MLPISKQQYQEMIEERAYSIHQNNLWFLRLDDWRHGEERARQQLGRKPNYWEVGGYAEARWLARKDHQVQKDWAAAEAEIKKEGYVVKTQIRKEEFYQRVSQTGERLWCQENRPRDEAIWMEALRELRSEFDREPTRDETSVRAEAIATRRNWSQAEREVHLYYEIAG